MLLGCAVLRQGLGLARMATPTLSIAPFVFLQLDNPGPEEGRQQTRGEGPDRPRLQLDNSEVAAAWWVPVQVLATRAAVKTLCLDLRLMGARTLAPILDSRKWQRH